MSDFSIVFNSPEVKAAMEAYLKVRDTVGHPNAHAIGQGAIIWVYISEIFPNHLRNSGQSFGVSVHWVLAAIIPSLVPLLFASIGPGVVFSIFAGFMVLQLLFVHFMMPETKGISLEELSKKLVS